ncbi:hypothetical protein P692DRAFT_20400768 [Suillus brevipes Sb2]|nr:hypothetical protein P692DRAFT_20400768 [Suillus brevipes Sb2]
MQQNAPSRMIFNCFTQIATQHLCGIANTICIVSVIILVVVAALASSTSAAPIDDQLICPILCRKNNVCHICEEFREFQWFPVINHLDSSRPSSASKDQTLGAK